MIIQLRKIHLRDIKETIKNLGPCWDLLAKI